MRHRSPGISRLHSSLLYSFDRCFYGCPEGDLDKLCVRARSYGLMQSKFSRNGGKCGGGRGKIDC